MGRGGEGVEESSQKGKGLMDLDNSVMIAGGGSIWELNSNEKK